MVASLELCWHINLCFPSQGGLAPPIPGKARALLDFISSVLSRIPFLGRDGAVCPGSWEWGAWVTGVNRRSCVSMSGLGGQERGPCLGRV